MNDTFLIILGELENPNALLIYVVLLSTIIAVWAIIIYWKISKRKVEEEKALRIKQNEKDLLIEILYSLKRIEKNTFSIKTGIVCIMILAFVLPVILTNL
jgi:hypothetical protein